MAFKTGRWLRRAAAGPAVPTLLLLATATLLARLLPLPGYYAVKLLTAGLLITLLVWLWQRTRRANLLLARFVAALAHGDFTQAFRMRDQGAGLEELGGALDMALDRLRAERLAAAGENRFAMAMLDEVPTPLLTIEECGRVGLANKAARHLFREADGLETRAFARYGSNFAALLAAMPPGGREICDLLWNGLRQRALVTASAIERHGASTRVIAIDIIHAELQQAELATQADLVRVLTHEIMNSLTPVTSLATSAAALLAGLSPADEASLLDARNAVGTLARRAQAITHFVDSYRDFAHVPTIHRSRFRVRPWADDLARAFGGLAQADGVALNVNIVPETLQIDCDPSLLTQVLLNLLKNGAEAATSHNNQPLVTLAILAADASRVAIVVTDNGPGVPETLINDIFLPFFTTKAQGTGVGLSFSRLVIQLHGGSIAATPASGRGGEFTITL